MAGTGASREEQGERRRRSVVPAALVLLALGPVIAGACSSTSRSSASGADSGASTTVVAPAWPSDARPSSGCAGDSSPATTTGHAADGPATIAVGGVDRHYVVTGPSDRPSDQPAPVVLGFHGFHGDSGSFSALTDLPARGTAAGAIVIVPDGAGDPQTWAFSGSGPDADLIDALLDDVEATRCVDLARVYATGFSAGAAFTIAYTCAHQDRIAAMATVAVDFQLGCAEGESILAFHGTADPAVPFDDGAVGASLPGVHVRGTLLNMGDWAELDGCASEPTTTTIGSEVTRSSWDGCSDDREVVLYQVVGGGHSWPGADPARGQGLTTRQVDATDEALAFFARHYL
ncbi:MAG: alpha/beta hydrolase family esterase [Acidimicrobiales bacterium]